MPNAGPRTCGGPAGAGSRWPARRTGTRRSPWPRANQAGLDPVWVLPEVDRATGLPGPVPAGAVRDALACHPDACAVFLGDPSYVGTTGDLAGHAAAAHDAG